MSKLVDFSFSDSPIYKTEFAQDQIKIYFEKAYKRSDYSHQDVILVISNWNRFDGEYVIRKDFTRPPIYQSIPQPDTDEFVLVQELNLSDEVLTLNGSSKDAGHWMIYKFYGSTHTVLPSKK